MALDTIHARTAAKLTPPSRAVRAIALATIAVLAGCDDRGNAQAKRAAPFQIPPEQCLGILTERDMSFETLPFIERDNGCAIRTPVSLSAMTAALSQPATMGCSLAVRFDDFERDILQPLAVRYFGQPVKRIHHYGAFACRNQVGGNEDRLSEHAFGRAIDVAAFELVDGSMIRVKQDWNGIGRRARFLRNVAREACDLFHVVLTPSHDAAHYDHLHFDTGPWRLCVT